jgi:hypothetical protein
MKIEANGSVIVLKEVFNGVLLETSEGNKLGICMRDDTFEINVMNQDSKEHHWHRVDMRMCRIEPMLAKDEPLIKRDIL